MPPREPCPPTAALPKFQYSPPPRLHLPAALTSHWRQQQGNESVLVEKKLSKGQERLPGVAVRKWQQSAWKQGLHLC